MRPDMMGTKVTGPLVLLEDTTCSQSLPGKLRSWTESTSFLEHHVFSLHVGSVSGVSFVMLESMAEKEVKVLYAWASPFVMRVMFALELKGIGYETIDEDTSNKSQLLLESNPVYKKIPVLFHKGKAIAESAVIVEYIDEAWPDKVGILPKDPYARAQDRFWADVVQKQFFHSACEVVFRGAGTEEFVSSCFTLENALGKIEDKPFFGGKTVGLVDVTLVSSAVWIPMLVEVAGLEMPGPEECPNLYQLFAALREHPAARNALPDLEQLKELFREVMPMVKKRYVSNSNT